jgi:hypothetical protein
MLNIVGAGLSRTGTYSLHVALEILGFKGLHPDDGRLDDVVSGANQDPDFRRFDDVDAVGDIPYSYFYRELHEAYPASKVILTVRNVEDWWNSISTLFNEFAPIPESPRLIHRISQKLGFGWKEDPSVSARRRTRTLVYGSSVAKKFLYKKKFAEHNALVQATIPRERLLVMDICAGDGWEKLCPFLGANIPNVRFPHTNKSDGN